MKKIVKIFVLLVFVLCLAGCSSDSDIDFKKDESLQVELLAQVKTFQDNILSLSDEEVEMYLASEDEDDEVMANAITSWTSIDDAGSYESGEYTKMDAKLKSSSAIYTCTLHFTERDVDMVVTFEDVDGEVAITDVTYSTVYSLGEQMSEAGLNTLMGMGIVFVVLIFISFIISLFKYIPKLMDKLSRKKEADTDKPDAYVYTEPDDTENNNTELVAVIAAAIAAAEGTSADSFVVRSIKRRDTNKRHRA